MLLPVRAEFTTVPAADKSIPCRVQTAGCGMDLARHSAPELGKRGLGLDGRFFPLLTSSLHGKQQPP